MLAFQPPHADPLLQIPFAGADSFLELRFEPFRHEHLEQRLIGHVALVDEEFEAIEHRLRHAQRDGLRYRPKVRERHPLRAAVVNEISRVVFGPELARPRS